MRSPSRKSSCDETDRKSPSQTYIGWLTADEMGLAFGRQTVIHAALASGGLTQRVVEEANRLRGVRENDGGNGRREG